MEKVFSLVEQKHGRNGKDLVIEAHAFMKSAHRNQKRAGGEEFHTHPEAVVNILVEQGHTDPVLLSAAFLHDVVEDTDVVMLAVRKKFGEEIAFLVDAATDVGRGDGKPRVADKYERMRLTQEKILGMGKQDSRIFLIKTADRLHNLRTVSALSQERQERLMKEARDFHTKLAHDAGEEELAGLIDGLVEAYLDARKE
ncbi:HD domain-containing protein [Candidatus Woesearchaeota archaeon]|nr:HD domain-containing protein [Candidatus Woesearchaeota archaeon]